MARGAFPPGFSVVEIVGNAYDFYHTYDLISVGFCWRSRFSEVRYPICINRVESQLTYPVSPGIIVFELSFCSLLIWLTLRRVFPS